jgi:hypothetical protein
MGRSVDFLIGGGKRKRAATPRRARSSSATDTDSTVERRINRRRLVDDIHRGVRLNAVRDRSALARLRARARSDSDAARDQTPAAAPASSASRASRKRKAPAAPTGPQDFVRRWESELKRQRPIAPDAGLSSDSSGTDARRARHAARLATTRTRTRPPARSPIRKPWMAPVDASDSSANFLGRSKASPRKRVRIAPERGPVTHSSDATINTSEPHAAGPGFHNEFEMNRFADGMLFRPPGPPDPPAPERRPTLNQLIAPSLKRAAARTHRRLVATRNRSLLNWNNINTGRVPRAPGEKRGRHVHDELSDTVDTRRASSRAMRTNGADATLLGVPAERQALLLASEASADRLRPALRRSSEPDPVNDLLQNVLPEAYARDRNLRHRQEAGIHLRGFRDERYLPGVVDDPAAPVNPVADNPDARPGERRSAADRLRREQLHLALTEGVGIDTDAVQRQVQNARQRRADGVSFVSFPPDMPVRRNQRFNEAMVDGRRDATGPARLFHDRVGHVMRRGRPPRPAALPVAPPDTPTSWVDLPAVPRDLPPWPNTHGFNPRPGRVQLGNPAELEPRRRRPSTPDPSSSAPLRPTRRELSQKQRQQKGRGSNGKWATAVPGISGKRTGVMLTAEHLHDRDPAALREEANHARRLIAERNREAMRRALIADARARLADAPRIPQPGQGRRARRRKA